jgi:hypothetical protein
MSARTSLTQMKHELDALGPVLPVSKLIPIVRSQVIAVQTIQQAGTMLSDAGLRLADATQRALDSYQQGTPISQALASLRTINESLASGATSVQQATKKVDKLKGKWLVGPIGSARDDLLTRLPHYSERATSAEDGLNALLEFAGGNGPRRYLFLSQNPDEIRPTGGFIGTYGIISAGDQLSLESFQDIRVFENAHPTATVPGGQDRSPFRFASIPFPQTLANVNSTPDFALAGKEAVDLWNGSGEQHVDGALSFTPAFLARLLGVLGPVDVADYGEHVDQSNLIDRFNFYTQEQARNTIPNTTRKEFVAALAEVVMQRLLAAPSGQWQALAQAVGQGFAARDAMAWSSDQQVQAALANRHWDGSLPKATGDFFYNAEFAYLAKSDRGLQRTFDHHVEVHPDGSARITTTMTISNTRPADPVINTGSLAYITMYGPNDATLDPASTKPQSTEPAMAGHPAAGWFLNAPPLGKASMTVVWDAKDIVRKGPNGTRLYSLTWLRVPDHTGDAVNLTVDLPSGWSWAGDAAPPSHIDLTQDVASTWRISTKPGAGFLAPVTRSSG